MKYRQLTLEKRYQVSALIKAGLNQKEVALEVGVHPSTISRELRRNRDVVRGYNAELAQIKSTKVEMQKTKRFSLTKPIEKYIRAKLKKDWSPEQIAVGFLKIKQYPYHMRPSTVSFIRIKLMVVNSIRCSGIKIRSIIREVITIREEALL